MTSIQKNKKIRLKISQGHIKDILMSFKYSVFNEIKHYWFIKESLRTLSIKIPRVSDSHFISLFLNKCVDKTGDNGDKLCL